GAYDTPRDPVTGLRETGKRTFEPDYPGQHVLVRHDDVVEEQSRSDGGPQRELSLDLRCGEAGGSLVDQKAANAILRHRPHHGDIGNRTVGDPHLRAIDDPVATAPSGARLHVG